MTDHTQRAREKANDLIHDWMNRWPAEGVARMTFGPLSDIGESIAQALREERERTLRESQQAVADLYLALREINGVPTMRDLIKLRKRLKEGV